MEKLDGKRIYVRTEGASGPTFVIGTFTRGEESIDGLMDGIRFQNPDADFRVVFFEVDGWNETLSPWPAPEVDASFTGKGQETLDWIRTSLLPYLKRDEAFGKSLYLGGYSLAGLFSLWAQYTLPELDGIFTCSGSLWYPGFLTFLSENKVPDHRKIYISVGGKENRAKDPLMAHILEDTKKASDILKSQAEVFYELNSGGHFADAGKRMGRGIAWLLHKSGNARQH